MTSLERGSTSSSLARENSVDIFPLEDEKKKQKKRMIKYGIGVLCAALICSAITGVAVYFSRKREIKVRTQPTRAEMFRIDCLPDIRNSKFSCEERGCVWSPSVVDQVPDCFYPDPKLDTWGYKVLSHPLFDTMPLRYILGLKTDQQQKIIVDVDFLDENFCRIKVETLSLKITCYHYSNNKNNMIYRFFLMTMKTGTKYQ